MHINTPLAIEMALNNVSQYKGYFLKADVECLVTKKEENTPYLLDSLDFYPNCPGSSR